MKKETQQISKNTSSGAEKVEKIEKKEYNKIYWRRYYEDEEFQNNGYG